MDRFLDHDYPGNVRELENLVERAVALETQTTIGPDHISASGPRPRIPQTELELGDDGVDLEQAVADLERRLITAALRRTSGVRKEAAKLLGISFRSLRYRLEKLGIEVARHVDGDGT
jgi:two-component system response regulator PilR (NtrC family)